MGGGILPVTVYRNKIFLLYGRENIDDKKNKERGKWSDFGGGREKNETSKQTAIREGWEETSGILGTQADIKYNVENNLLGKISYSGDGKGTYSTYLIMTPYDPTLPKKLETVYKRALKKEPEKVFQHNGLYEKDTARWFALDELIKNKHMFRKWYIPMLYKTVRFFEKRVR